MSETVYCDGKVEEDTRRLPPNQVHPRVFLTFGEQAQIFCPYCGRCFKKAQKQHE